MYAKDILAKSTSERYSCLNSCNGKTDLNDVVKGKVFEIRRLFWIV